VKEQPAEEFDSVEAGQTPLAAVAVVLGEEADAIAGHECGTFVLEDVRTEVFLSQSISATELRANVYRILDRVLETGEAQEVIRNGSKLLIMPATRQLRRLDGRPKRNVLACSVDELVATSWEKEWNPDP